MSSSSLKETLKVRRPPNQFMLYRTDVIQKLTNNAKAVGASLPRQSRLSKIVGAMWKNESEEVRAGYTTRAEKVKEEHEKAHPDYQYRPQRKKRKFDEDNGECDEQTASASSMASVSSPSSVNRVPKPAIPTTPALSQSHLHVDPEAHYLRDDAHSQTNAIWSQWHTPCQPLQMTEPLTIPGYQASASRHPSITMRKRQPPGAHQSRHAVWKMNAQQIPAKVAPFPVFQQLPAPLPDFQQLPALLPVSEQLHWDVECAPLNAGFCDFDEGRNRVMSDISAPTSIADNSPSASDNYDPLFSGSNISSKSAQLHQASITASSSSTNNTLPSQASMSAFFTDDNPPALDLSDQRPQWVFPPIYMGVAGDLSMHEVLQPPPVIPVDQPLFYGGYSGLQHDDFYYSGSSQYSDVAPTQDLHPNVLAVTNEAPLQSERPLYDPRS